MSLGIIQVIESIDLQAKEAVEKLSPKGLNKKYYRLNKSFVLYSELSGLFSKSHLLLEKELLTELRPVGPGSLFGFDWFLPASAIRLRIC